MTLSDQKLKMSFHQSFVIFFALSTLKVNVHLLSYYHSDFSITGLQVHLVLNFLKPLTFLQIVLGICYNPGTACNINRFSTANSSFSASHYAVCNLSLCANCNRNSANKRMLLCALWKMQVLFLTRLFLRSYSCLCFLHQESGKKHDRLPSK